MKTKKTISLRKTLILIFAGAWIIPITCFTWFIFHDYQQAYLEKTDNLMHNAMEVSGVLVQTDLDEAIGKMQKPTYEGEWESNYRKYAKGNMKRSEFLTTIKSSLISKYYMDDQISRYAYYMVSEDVPCCYSGKNGYGYDDYMEYVQPLVKEISKKNSSYVEVHVVDNQIYLIRNLYTVNEYKKYGTLVLGLDKSLLFKEIPLENREDIRICFGDDAEYMTENKPQTETVVEKENLYQKLFDASEQIEDGTKIYSREESGYAGYAYTVLNDNYRFNLYYLLPKKELYAGINQLNMILVVLMCGMVPIMIITYHILTKNINKPLYKIMAASKEMKDGELGITVEENKIPNEEFKDLASSFNEMSIRVKHLFNTVYLEKMATKDAQIEALQAQINPHFLNNTLEMMNWQARMNDDIETSKMIEALGTVLDSSMNRSNDRLVRLADELHCGDAFLYIMSMRFGQRLKVVKNIDQSLNQMLVPQLILQPLLENAIKHGIEKVSSGTIWVNIYPDGERAIIDVVNTGNSLTEAQLARIDRIIEGKDRLDRSEPGAHTSIGIYNVNKRIQLIFGSDYGLRIFQGEKDEVISRIVIPGKPVRENNPELMGGASDEKED